MINNKYRTPERTELKGALVQLLEKLRKPPKDPQELAELICVRIEWREQASKEYGAHEPYAKQMEKLDAYIKCLQATRRAWTLMSRHARDCQLDYAVESEATLLPGSVIVKLPTVYYSDKTELPEWRREGLDNVDGWGYSLEMLDILYESALWYKGIANQSKRNNGSPIGFVAEVAKLCERRGIALSSKPRSVFSKIICVIFPEIVDPSGLIKTALKVDRGD